MTSTMQQHARRHAARLALVAAALGLAGCGEKGGNEPAEPRTYAFSLVTPRSDDGAVVVALTGTPVTSVVVSGASARLYTRQVSPSEVRVMILGNVAAGQLFTATSTTGRRPTATVLEVADRADAMRATVQGYSITSQ